MDNFNVTASQDQVLDVILKYRCRILFTTRSRYENHITREVAVDELKPSVQSCSVLLDEKKATSALNILKQRELAKRIATGTPEKAAQPGL